MGRGLYIGRNCHHTHKYLQRLLASPAQLTRQRPKRNTLPRPSHNHTWPRCHAITYQKLQRQRWSSSRSHSTHSFPLVEREEAKACWETPNAIKERKFCRELVKLSTELQHRQSLKATSCGLVFPVISQNSFPPQRPAF